MTRILAFLCKVCPFCICARRWPETRFAGWLAEKEKLCPACRAYEKVTGKGQGGEGTNVKAGA